MIAETQYDRYGRHTLIALLIVLLASAGPAWCENWPGWRGPRGDGTSLEKDVPQHWSGTGNVIWKTPLPGKGHASPIVWQDRVFVTASTEFSDRPGPVRDFLLQLHGFRFLMLTRLC